MSSSRASASVSFSDQNSYSNSYSRSRRRQDESLYSGSYLGSLSAVPSDESTVVDESSSSTSEEKDEDESLLDQPSEEFHDASKALEKARAAKRFKIIAILLLVCLAVLVIVLVWYFTKEEEEDDFEQQYETFALRVVDSTEQSLDQLVWTGFALASTFTSRFSTNGTIQGSRVTPSKSTMSWPNVTVVDFQDQARGSLLLSDASTVFFAPLVTSETFSSWYEYISQVHKKIPQPELGHHSQKIIIDPPAESPPSRKRIPKLNDFGDYVAFPLWHIAPRRGNEGGFLFDAYRDPIRRDAINTMLATKRPAFTDVLFRGLNFHKGDRERHKEPTTILFTPIFREFDSSDIVGTIGLEFLWTHVLDDILPPNVEGLLVVLESSGSGLKFTFELNGNRAVFLGPVDLHDDKFDNKEVTYTYDIPTVPNDGLVDSSRQISPGDSPTDGLRNDTATTYTIRIYPSSFLKSQYTSNQPAIYAAIVALVFFLVASTFMFYSCIVQSRQAEALKVAYQNNRIVEQLFPRNVRERLISEADPTSISPSSPSGRESAGRLKRYLKRPTSSPGVSPLASAENRSSSMSSSVSPSQSDPIADMFTATTILFADIAGFTAWSSEREPSQVFVLLENIYREFDLEAKKYGVFKIETIGDCYVAATGLPDPQKDHAVIMARFAQRCLVKFVELTKELELTLGPGTAALGLRIGMHSGAVTGGVLRGEKSRFQLFGDTMNTASRMESQGKTNMIQVSPDTAALLREAGKEHWLIKRPDIVIAKGKGEIQTYWIRTNMSSRYGLDSSPNERRPLAQSRPGPVEEKDVVDKPAVPPRGNSTRAFSSNQQDLDRLIRWNSAVLEDLLLKVMVHRQFYGTSGEQRVSDLEESSSSDETHRSTMPSAGSFSASDETDSNFLVVDEMTDEVSFESYRTRTTDPMETTGRIMSIPEAASEELTFYVACVASMYRNVPFHNFDHASHVTLSASKLMKRICTARKTHGPAKTKEDEEAQIDLFFKTFGISSDPLAQFAVVFAALVHDVDHFGITNAELIKVKPDFAAKFHNISVAEQNSIHVAWELLMEPDFPTLRKCIFGNNADRQRFKQLLIHMIIATDIADKKRMEKEKKRWNEAFCNMPEWERKWRNKSAEELANVDVSFRATAVLEQIMLASDVAHTMQHWMVYIKWNEKFFYERIAAFAAGMTNVDPRVDWYENELGFFDFYIIPLAKRLKECGVFGTAGEEYLGYALKNRQEWIEKGRFILESYIRRVENENLLSRRSSERSRRSSRRRITLDP